MMSGTSGTSGAAGPEYDWSWTDDDPTWVPPEIDTTKPSPARMYDYALGGKDNFEVDRRAVEQVATVLPDFRYLAQANRQFLVKTVRIMAQAGIKQYIDLGTGIPTSPNVHEMAREIQPDARVVYVDNDPIVMAHNRALRAVVDDVITVQRDIREPDTIVSDARVRELIDVDQPVGVLFVSVLHFVRRDLAPEVVSRFRSLMAPGSYVAISTACTDGMDAATVAKTEAVYQSAAAPMVFRTRSEVQQLFDGFELLEPGLADVSQWRNTGTPTPIRILAGMGRKN